MTKRYVLDTNVLLTNPGIVNDYQVVVLADVLRELEKHKLSHNKELAFNARRATRKLDELSEQIVFDLNDYSVQDDRFDKDYVDNRIIVACKSARYGLITNDLLLKFKAKGEGIEVIQPQEDSRIQYKGYVRVSMTDEELAYFYSNLRTNTYELALNQYIIIEKNGVVVDKYRWNGDSHQPLKLPPKKVIKAENELQEIALDLLNDTNVPIKIIAGTYGSGKTYLNTKMGVYHIKEKGNYSSLMVVRNPIGTGEAIGWLKGTKEDKTNDFFKPVIQHLEGGEQEAFLMEQAGQLTKEIPFYMKGLTVSNTFMLVDEAEDLDVKLIKTIGTRLGKGSVITFSGDYQQSEDKFTYNNGLLHAINTLKDDPLVGVVVLDEDVRSDASKVFSNL